MAYKLKGAPYPKRTKTFTTDDAGNVRKTVTRTSRKGDIKAKKVVDYDASGTKTKKVHFVGEQAGDFAGTRTVVGTGLDAKVTDRKGRTGTRRENIKRDIKNVAKGATVVAGMTTGMMGGIVGLGKGGKTIAGLIPRVWGGGAIGAALGTDVANKITGGASPTSGFPEGTGNTKMVLSEMADMIKGGVQKVKNVPGNIKKKVHAKRISKSKK